MKEPPEQLAQSGWQVRQEPDDEKVAGGQVETQFPLDASLFAAHVRQKLDVPEHVEHVESQAEGWKSVEKKD